MCEKSKIMSIFRSECEKNYAFIKEYLTLIYKTI